MTKLIISALLLLLIALPEVAADQKDDVAADAVVAAFNQARKMAHLSKLERMGRNTFRKQVCNRDMRFPSGLINSAIYETPDPTNLPEPALRLAASPDTYKIATRLAVGVCSVDGSSLQHPKYSIVVATYESRWISFQRIFWE